MGLSALAPSRTIEEGAQARSSARLPGERGARRTFCRSRFVDGIRIVFLVLDYSVSLVLLIGWLTPLGNTHWNSALPKSNLMLTRRRGEQGAARRRELSWAPVREGWDLARIGVPGTLDLKDRGSTPRSA